MLWDVLSASSGLNLIFLALFLAVLVIVLLSGLDLIFNAFIPH